MYKKIEIDDLKEFLMFHQQQKINNELVEKCKNVDPDFEQIHSSRTSKVFHRIGLGCRRLIKRMAYFYRFHEKIYCNDLMGSFYLFK